MHLFGREFMDPATVNLDGCEPDEFGERLEPTRDREVLLDVGPIRLKAIGMTKPMPPAPHSARLARQRIVAPGDRWVVPGDKTKRQAEDRSTRRDEGKVEPRAVPGDEHPGLNRCEESVGLDQQRSFVGPVENRLDTAARDGDGGHRRLARVESIDRRVGLDVETDQGSSSVNGVETRRGVRDRWRTGSATACRSARTTFRLALRCR